MNISIIIVEYKDINIVRRAVQSIKAHVKGIKYEIVVISNSSYCSDEKQAAKKAWIGCKIVFQDNVGFSSAVNNGIDMSVGKYIILLNPDTEFFDSSLEKAIDFMEAHPEVAVVGPKILNNKTEIQDSCREFMTFSILFKRMMKRAMKKSSGAVLENRDYAESDRVDWVSGACMLVRKQAIDHAGKMDDRYFMYVEDMDWCRNFSRNGWQIWFFPEWSIEHNAGRGSSGGNKIFNRLRWIHMASFIKYTVKWAFE